MPAKRTANKGEDKDEVPESEPASVDPVEKPKDKSRKASDSQEESSDSKEDVSSSSVRTVPNLRRKRFCRRRFRHRFKQAQAGVERSGRKKRTRASSREIPPRKATQINSISKRSKAIRGNPDKATARSRIGRKRKKQKNRPRQKFKKPRRLPYEETEVKPLEIGNLLEKEELKTLEGISSLAEAFVASDSDPLLLDELLPLSLQELKDHAFRVGFGD